MVWTAAGPTGRDDPGGMKTRLSATRSLGRGDSVTTLSAGRTQPAPAIAFQGVSKAFGPVEVLHDVTFSVAPGQTACLMSGDRVVGAATIAGAAR